MFSSRVPGALEPNRLTRALRRLRATGRHLIDLTRDAIRRSRASQYPSSILDALADRRSLRYEPAPLGLPDARAAIARDYERHGIKVAPERVVLTASTSEAYSILFKLLCAPAGDARDGSGAELSAVRSPDRARRRAIDPYRLEFHGRWAVDFDTLDAGWNDTVRAVLAVSPNNPTGSVLTAAEAGRHWPSAARRAMRRSSSTKCSSTIRLIAARHRPPSASATCLTFRLGGLSKSAGLPQVKLGWIVVDGPEAARARGARSARADLRHLPVGLDAGSARRRRCSSQMARCVRAAILDRVRATIARCAPARRSIPRFEVLPCEAGWSAVLRVPSTRTEEDLAIELLETAGVVVHPGFFFDFPHEAFLVVSLLPEPASSPRAFGGSWSWRMPEDDFADRRHAGCARAALLHSLARELGDRRDSRPGALRRLAGSPPDSTSSCLLPVNEMADGQNSPYSAHERDGHRSDLYRPWRCRGVRGGGRGIVADATPTVRRSTRSRRSPRVAYDVIRDDQVARAPGRISAVR